MLLGEDVTAPVSSNNVNPPVQSDSSIFFLSHDTRTNVRFDSKVNIPIGPHCLLYSKLLINWVVAPSYDDAGTLITEGKEDFCWFWTASRDSEGYGQFYVGSHNGQRVDEKAHRYSLCRAVNRPLKNGLLVDHSCHNHSGCRETKKKCVHRACVRPSHLLEKTDWMNVNEGNRVSHEDKPTFDVPVIDTCLEQMTTTDTVAPGSSEFVSVTQAMEQEKEEKRQEWMPRKTPEMEAILAREVTRPIPPKGAIKKQIDVGTYWQKMAESARWEREKLELEAVEYQRNHPPPVGSFCSLKDKTVVEDITTITSTVIGINNKSWSSVDEHSSFKVFDEVRGDYVHRPPREGDVVHSLCSILTCTESLLKIWFSRSEYVILEENTFEPHVHSYSESELLNVEEKMKDPLFDRVLRSLYRGQTFPTWQYQIDERKCPSCSGRIINDNDNGDVVCSDCGRVINEHVVSSDAFHTQSGMIADNECNMTTEMSNPLIFGVLGSLMGTPGSSSQSNSGWMEKGKGELVDIRMKTLEMQNRGRSFFKNTMKKWSSSSTEGGERAGLDDISHDQQLMKIMEKLKLPQSVFIETSVLVQKCTKILPISVGIKKKIAFFSLVTACRTQGMTNISLKEIEKVFNDMGVKVKAKDAMRLAMDIPDEMKKPPATAEEHLKRFPALLTASLVSKGAPLGHQYKILTIARGLMKLTSPEEKMKGYMPITVAATMYYAADRMLAEEEGTGTWEKGGLTQGYFSIREVASSVGIGDFGIQEMFADVFFSNPEKWAGFKTRLGILLKEEKIEKAIDVEILPPEEEPMF